MKKFVENVLYILSKKILEKYKPKVIGITGSVGKTSTKNAVETVLSEKFKVRGSIKNYNNEIGVPLSIIGAESAGKSLLKWLLIFAKALRLIIFTEKKYPEVLVLEMGADKIGDISYLTELAPCDIGVLTHIAHDHLEKFKTVEKLTQEKQVIISHLNRENHAVVNYDVERVRNCIKHTKAQVLTYGKHEDADVRAIEFETRGKGLSVDGLNFKVVYNGSTIPVFIPNVIGEHTMYASLAAAAIGISMGMNLVDIAQGLRNYKMPPGRMTLIEGIKHSLIIDDTYKGGPEATLSALQTMRQIELTNDSKRIAVLGNMLELGSYTEKGHELIGKGVVDYNVNILITIGELGSIISKYAKKLGMDEMSIHHFNSSEEAGRFLQGKIKKGDVILVKGSQSMRMEKIVKEVMAHPLQAEDLLVRQSKSWKN